MNNQDPRFKRIRDSSPSQPLLKSNKESKIQQLRDSSPTRLSSSQDSYLTIRGVNDSGELGFSANARRNRRPFHYPVSQRGHVQPDPDIGVAATYDRYRYYSRLAAPSIETLSIPDHVIPEPFFHPFLILPVEGPGTQSSVITIFAMWNTMMGTSLLSMPWAIEKAGFACGLFLIVLMGLLCTYTAFRIIEMPKLSGLLGASVQFSDICSHYLGTWAKWVSLFFSIVPLLGGAIVYWVLMSNFLYHGVLFFYEKFTGEGMPLPLNDSLDVFCVTADPVDLNSTITLPDDLFYKIWDLDGTVPLFLVVCLGPMISLKSPTFFAKFNALGTLSVLYLCVFAVIKAYFWGGHINVVDVDSPDYVPYFKFSFPALTGILSMAYFIHNGVLTLFKNQRNPENNARDLVIAFCLVGSTYVILGTIFYVYFPLPKSCIQDNILNNFEPSDLMAVITRIFLLFQLLTVFPLIIYWSRIQLLLAIFNKPYPGAKHVFVLNFLILTTCILFAIYLPQIGNIIRYCGALSGLAYIFTLPSVVYMKAMWQRNLLSATSVIFHLIIISLGVANFVAQFFV